MVQAFHALPDDRKINIAMDRSDWHVGGVGYLSIRNTKLPARKKGNLNEAFIVKRDLKTSFCDNQWPDESVLPGFRDSVETYAATMEQLSKQLLPVFAAALDMAPDFFDAAFTSPAYRLRMTHYPPTKDQSADEFGISPHVDTTFFTILAQDQPGLVIFSEKTTMLD